VSEVSKRFNALAERIGIKARVLSVYPGTEDNLEVLENIVDRIEELEQKTTVIEFPFKPKEKP
jgi:hypothetical protein